MRVDSKNIDIDYDKEPIVINDYGVYFQLSFIMLIFSIVIFLWVFDFENGRFEGIKFGSFDFFRIVIVAILIIWFIHFLYKLPKKFQAKPSYFKVSNNNLEYIEHFYDKDGIKTELNIPVSIIKSVSFCIVAELPDRYGRWGENSTWKKNSKFALDMDFSDLVLFVRYAVTYAVFTLPYKLWRLYSTKEPYFLLKKNLFIQFKNRNYFLVNIYSQKELDELLEYFQKRNIPINQKTYFIPHLQNQGWFVDREEVWAEGN